MEDFRDLTRILVIVPEGNEDLAIKAGTKGLHFHGIGGPCSVQTDKGMGEGFRYRLCGIQYRGLVIDGGAKLSRGALEYLMTRMRNPYENNGVPWVFRFDEYHTQMLKRIVEERFEELLSHEGGYYRESAIRHLLKFYKEVVKLDLSDCDYVKSGYEEVVRNTTIREMPYRGTVFLSQQSDEANHTDMLEISISDIPAVISALKKIHNMA